MQTGRVRVNVPASTHVTNSTIYVHNLRSQYTQADSQKPLTSIPIHSIPLKLNFGECECFIILIKRLYECDKEREGDLFVRLISWSVQIWNNKYTWLDAWALRVKQIIFYSREFGKQTQSQLPNNCRQFTLCKFSALQWDHGIPIFPHIRRWCAFSTFRGRDGRMKTQLKCSINFADYGWNDDNNDSNRIQFRNYSINKVLIASSANKFMATPFYLADISWILSIVLLVSVEMETLFLPFCQRKKSHIQEKEPWASSNSEKCGKQDFKWHKRRSEYTKRNAKSSMENNVLFWETAVRSNIRIADTDNVYSFFIRSLAISLEVPKHICRHHTNEQLFPTTDF